MRDELLEQSLKRCDEVFAEPARQIEQLQSALKAENNTLLAENAQLKAHNRQLVEATKESLALHQNWRSNAEPEELAYYSEHKIVIGGLVDALQTPPAKLALAEAEVLRAAERLDIDTVKKAVAGVITVSMDTNNRIQNELNDIIIAHQAMQEAKRDA